LLAFSLSSIALSFIVSLTKGGMDFGC
jgi:hypothetical protein